MTKSNDRMWKMIKGTGTVGFLFAVQCWMAAHLGLGHHHVHIQPDSAHHLHVHHHSASAHSHEQEQAQSSANQYLAQGNRLHASESHSHEHSLLEPRISPARSEKTFRILAASPSRLEHAWRPRVTPAHTPLWCDDPPPRSVSRPAHTPRGPPSFSV